MHRMTLRNFSFAVLAVAACVVATLWSFNSLSELFGGPQAQARHAVAFILLLAAVRWLPGANHHPDRHCQFNRWHARPGEEQGCEH